MFESKLFTVVLSITSIRKWKIKSVSGNIVIRISCAVDVICWLHANRMSIWISESQKLYTIKDSEIVKYINNNFEITVIPNANVLVRISNVVNLCNESLIDIWTNMYWERNDIYVLMERILSRYVNNIDLENCKTKLCQKLAPIVSIIKYAVYTSYTLLCPSLIRLVKMITNLFGLTIFTMEPIVERQIYQEVGIKTSTHPFGTQQSNPIYWHIPVADCISEVLNRRELHAKREISWDLELKIKLPKFKNRQIMPYNRSDFQGQLLSRVYQALESYKNNPNTSREWISENTITIQILLPNDQ